MWYKLLVFEFVTNMRPVGQLRESGEYHGQVGERFVVTFGAPKVVDPA
jgi:hypothetical protein